MTFFRKRRTYILSFNKVTPNINIEDMNILKAAERISKNHLGDVSTFTLKFIRVNGEWKSVDHDYKWNHGFTLMPFDCFNDLCQKLSYDGEHTEVQILVSD